MDPLLIENLPVEFPVWHYYAVLASIGSLIALLIIIHRKVRHYEVLHHHGRHYPAAHWRRR